MGSAFAAQPEFFEHVPGEALAARTQALASFRELGPPDLCHVTKRAGRSEQSSYHYVSGVDASSSAALAAYVTSLTHEVSPPSSWLSTPWAVTSGTYCCFNAFSCIDVRVDASIPGGVDAYAVDLRGERHATSPEIWQEVDLSALLRSILYSDDPHYRLPGYRMLDPLSSLEAEQRFLQAAENLFFKGWQLGSDPEIQVPTLVNNHLAKGIFKHFGDANRLEHAVNLFEKLRAREPECAVLVAQAYLGMNEEIKAVNVMHEAFLSASSTNISSKSYALLHVQAEFLRQRDEVEWAHDLAIAAVKCAPTEFVTWAKLTHSYIELGRWDDALYTLNSCPMFTFEARNLHRMPPPARTLLPVKPLVAASGLLAEDASSNLTALATGTEGPLSILTAGAAMPAAAGPADADPALLRLQAPALWGTYAQAYVLLTELVSKIGWDEVLRRRSNIFWMEEDYCAQQSTQESQAADKSACWVGEGEFLAKNKLAPTTNGTPFRPRIPTIKISPGSDAGESVIYRGSFDADVCDLSWPDQLRYGHKDSTETHGSDVDSQPMDGDSEQTVSTEATSRTTTPGGDLEEECEPAEGGRRLCERWLDNLFITLYEDLRIYTIWQVEMEHYRNIRKPYNKTSLEWEILGDLALRLKHPLEAKEAYLRCLTVSGSAPNGVGSPGHWSADSRSTGRSTVTTPSSRQQGHRFSAKAHHALLEMYTAEGDVRRAVWLAVKLTAYYHRWYSEVAYPTAVGKALFTLIQNEGLARVSFTLVSLDPPRPILRLMQKYFAYAQAFHVPGWDF